MGRLLSRSIAAASAARARDGIGIADGGARRDDTGSRRCLSARGANGGSRLGRYRRAAGCGFGLRVHASVSAGGGEPDVRRASGVAKTDERDDERVGRCERQREPRSRRSTSDARVVAVRRARDARARALDEGASARSSFRGYDRIARVSTEWSRSRESPSRARRARWRETHRRRTPRGRHRGRHLSRLHLRLSLARDRRCRSLCNVETLARAAPASPQLSDVDVEFDRAKHGS